MWLSRLSIERPIFMSMIELFLMVLGVIGFLRLGVDMFPEIDPPIITITTKYPGAGPSEIESLVSKQIEDAVSEIGGIDTLTSISREGVSQVVIEFVLDKKAKEMLVEVRDKVARIRSLLPDDVEEPLVERLDLGAKPILQIALTNKINASASGEQIPEAKLRIYAKELVKPKFQQIDGIGQVNIFGGTEREVVVDLDRQKMLLWKLTPSMVTAAVKSSNVNIPAGEIKEEPRRRSLRILGEYQNIAEIKDTIIKTFPGGKTLTLKDIGTVKDTFKERDSFARVNGSPVVMMELKKTSDANTVAVVDEIQKRLPLINSFLPQGAELKTIFDNAKSIRMSLDDVMETMVIAAILAVIVIYFFLGSWQSTLITGLALPLVLTASMFGLYLAGYTLNMMTLLGLTLAVGLLIDDAIVVRENIWRKIEEGLPPKQAAYDGTKEVQLAVVATSLVIIAAFFPVVFIPGIVGRFFTAFGLTVCLCIVFSLFDALTMAPMLSAYMISKKNLAKHNHEKDQSRFWQKITGKLSFSLTVSERMTDVYTKLLRWSLSHPLKVLLSAAGIFVLSLFLLRFVGFTFMPNTEYGELNLDIEAPQGTSANKTNELMQTMENFVKTYPEVELVSSRVGNDLGETNVGSLFVKLVPTNQRKKSTTDLKIEFREKLSSLVAAEKLALSVKTAGGGPGQKTIQVSIQGVDTQTLFELGQKVLERAKKEVSETVDLDTDMKPGRKELQFTIDRLRTSIFGLNTRDVGYTIRGFFEGELAGSYREQGQEFDLRVRLRPEDRLGISSLENLTITNNRNEAIPLSAVTSYQSGTSPTKITRVDRQRAVQIVGDLAPGAPLAKAIDKLRDLVTPMLPQGYRVDFRGQFRTMRDLMVGMMIAVGLASLVIYMIMASLYESLMIPFAILLTLPLAVAGTFLALLSFGKLFDIYAVIGILLLVGLVTKNAILLVDRVEQLRAQGKDQKTALLEGGTRRFRPIIMTTMATIVAMVPVAVGFGELNAARSSMGLATIGGLFTSTLLSLVVIPCAYIYLDNFRNWLKRKF